MRWDAPLCVDRSLVRRLLLVRKALTCALKQVFFAETTALSCSFFSSQQFYGSAVAWWWLSIGWSRYIANHQTLLACRLLTRISALSFSSEKFFFLFPSPLQFGPSLVFSTAPRSRIFFFFLREKKRVIQRHKCRVPFHCPIANWGAFIYLLKEPRICYSRNVSNVILGRLTKDCLCLCLCLSLSVFFFFLLFCFLRRQVT